MTRHRPRRPTLLWLERRDAPAVFVLPHFGGNGMWAKSMHASTTSGSNVAHVSVTSHSNLGGGATSIMVK